MQVHAHKSFDPEDKAKDLHTAMRGRGWLDITFNRLTVIVQLILS